MVDAVLLGLKACVVALVLQALLKIGKRALKGPLHYALAVGAFVALEWLRVPFPLIVLAAATIGFASAWKLAPATPSLAAEARAGHSPWPVLLGGLALWLVPLAVVVAALGGDSLWTRLYLFFTQAALVTFGGAYAVLGYVTQHLVEQLGWVTAEQSVAGLALAETTPGPLVIVLQFLGFMAGWNQPGPLTPGASALLAALLTAWATFLPSFVFIFVGAPYVERITRNPRAAGALAAITAAVVGIIAALTLLVARVVLFPQGLAAGPDWAALAIAVASWFALQRANLALPWVLAGAALAGWLASVLAGALG